MATDRSVRFLVALRGASTSRVLNLLRIHQLHADNPEHLAKPLFLSPIVNKAFVLKRRTRSDEFVADAGKQSRQLLGAAAPQHVKVPALRNSATLIDSVCQGVPLDDGHRVATPRSGRPLAGWWSHSGQHGPRRTSTSDRHDCHGAEHVQHGTRSR